MHESPIRRDPKIFAIEILEEEILDLEGEKRERALKAYRRLLLSLANEPVYLMRS